MTRAALRSVLGLAGITGLVGSGLVLGSVTPALADALPEPCARAADFATVTCTWSSTGAQQAFVVPQGVTKRRSGRLFANAADGVGLRIAGKRGPAHKHGVHHAP